MKHLRKIAEPRSCTYYPLEFISFLEGKTFHHGSQYITKGNQRVWVNRAPESPDMCI